MISRHARTAATSVSILAVLVAIVVAGQPNQPARVAGLYDPDPQHLWNRLHRHLQVRTAADGREFGLDEVDPLLWSETRRLLSGPHTRRPFVSSTSS